MTSGAQSRTRCDLLADFNRQGLRLSFLLRVYQRGSARNQAYLMCKVSIYAGHSEVLHLAIEIALPVLIRLRFVIAMPKVQA